MPVGDFAELRVAELNKLLFLGGSVHLAYTDRKAKIRILCGSI